MDILIGDLIFIVHLEVEVVDKMAAEFVHAIQGLCRTLVQEARRRWTRNTISTVQALAHWSFTQVDDHWTSIGYGMHTFQPNKYSEIQT